MSARRRKPPNQPWVSPGAPEHTHGREYATVILYNDAELRAHLRDDHYMHNVTRHTRATLVMFHRAAHRGEILVAI